MEKHIYLATPTKVSEKIIYDIYCDNYDSIHYLFVEFQFSWLQQAYNALKDIDKYNILVFLYKENFLELTDIIFEIELIEDIDYVDVNQDDILNIIDLVILMNRILDEYPQEINISNIDYDFQSININSRASKNS